MENQNEPNSSNIKNDLNELLVYPSLDAEPAPTKIYNKKKPLVSSVGYQDP